MLDICCALDGQRDDLEEEAGIVEDWMLRIFEL